MTPKQFKKEYEIILKKAAIRRLKAKIRKSHKR